MGRGGPRGAMGGRGGGMRWFQVLI
jgi:hypothetical protein